MAPEILRLSAVSKFYTGSQSVVMGLQEVNLSFTRGEFVAITGESGSGKSTLSHVLGGILPYESGELYFGGNPTSHFDSGDWERYRRDHISFISQNYGILPGATVIENVVSALILTGMGKSQARERAQKLLKQVELWPMRNRRAAKLSSGQKQRLSIARALAKPAPILIADEPTGNLDPENSEKVVSLLAQAAQERLVILVTHEFSEVAQLATRHIVLQDGKVVMDAALAPPAQPEPMERREKVVRPVGGYVGRLQQRGRPVWSGFIAVFFALTAFAVFAFLGTLLMNLDDSGTKTYDKSVFRNGDPQRIVVATADGAPMTAQDLDVLANLNYVQRLEPWGYVTDSRYGYREGVDFDFVVVENAVGADGTQTQVNRYPVIRANAPYLQTVPVLPGEQEFLTAGRLPENLYEVVAVGDASLIGTTYQVYLTNEIYWPVSKYWALDVEVVGVTDQGTDLYFHQDLARVWMQVRLACSRTDLRNLSVFLPQDTVGEGEFIPTMDQIGDMDSAYYRNLDDMRIFETLVDDSGSHCTAFFDTNSLWDPERESTVKLEPCSQWDGDFFLTNIRTGDRLFYSNVKNGCMTLSQEVGSTFWCFYPLEVTGTDPNGLVAPGTYLIYSKYSHVALVNEITEVDGELCYGAVPITLEEDGTITDYPPEAVWTVSIQTGSVYTISSNGAYLTHGDTPRETQSRFDWYWSLRKVRYYEQIADSDQGFIPVSPETFDRLTWDGGSEQVSLTITDYAYTQRVLDQAQALGYAAVSPYQLGSNKQDEALAQEREQTLLICLVALAVVIALQLILLRAMFGTQMESYRLLSNIGLSAAMAGRSILWQILTFALVGQALSGGTLALCRHFGVARIVSILHYLAPEAVALLVGVHLLVSLAAAWWIIRTLHKQVYALTTRETDLAFEDEQREVAL